MSHSRDALPSPSDNASAPPSADMEPPVNPDADGAPSSSFTTTDSAEDAENEDAENEDLSLIHI